MKLAHDIWLTTASPIKGGEKGQTIGVIDWPTALIASSIRPCWPGGRGPARSSQTTCPLTSDRSSTCVCWRKPCCPTLCHSTPPLKYCKRACLEVNATDCISISTPLTLPNVLMKEFLQDIRQNILVCSHQRCVGWRITSPKNENWDVIYSPSCWWEVGRSQGLEEGCPFKSPWCRSKWITDIFTLSYCHSFPWAWYVIIPWGHQ